MTIKRAYAVDIDSISPYLFAESKGRKGGRL
jgi:hypothetical protein